MAKMESPTSAKLIAEFTGTFLLIFTVGCNVLSKSGIWAGTSIACVLMVAIFAFGGTSGANFNPAVSVALGLNGNMKWPEVGKYCGTQIVAGILAGFCYFGLMGSTFNLAPSKGFSAVSAGACETLYTFVLVFVVLNVAAVEKGCQQWFGLAIGWVVIAGAYGAGAVSGGCFNPAVAFGIDVSSAHLGIGWCIAYTVFELLGAAIAVGLFKAIRPKGGTEEEKFEWPDQAPSILLSEFTGAFVLILTVGLNVMAASPAGAFSIAASLMCMIYALGDVSGAKFNPAVSLAVFLTKTPGHPIPRTLAEMGAQIGGGVVAGFTYAGIYGFKAFPLGPGAGYNIVQAGVAEVMFTFVLCLVVLCAAVYCKDNKPNKDDPSKDGPTAFFGLAIGACVTCGGNAIGAISGGSLNPAVSFGIASAATLSHGTGSLFHAIVYSVAEFIGASMAVAVCLNTTMVEKVPVPEEEPADAEKAKKPN